MLSRVFPLCVVLIGTAPALAWADEDPGHDPKTYQQPDDAFDDHVEGAERLEGRLLAPCCWDGSRQTLDIHGSPIANQLRREIRSRLRAGESPDAIEADLVRRYTTKILAVPPGNPLKEVGLVLSIALVVAGGALASMLVRWRRRSPKGDPPTGAPPASGEADPWDDKLDRELAKID